MPTDEHDALGPGAMGAWSEEELAHLPQPVPKSPPARQDDDPDALRRGVAEANRREASTEPLVQEDAHAVPGENRGGMMPGNEGTRRGEEELERGTE